MSQISLENEIQAIIENPKLNIQTREEFRKLLIRGKYIRDDGALHHFSVYFLPFNSKEKKVFLVHHKKAKQWLAPGGHIDVGETLLQTLNREIEEELGILNNFSSLPQPFHISIVELETPRPACAKHYDIWFLFETDGADFKIDSAEFLETKWLTIDEAKRLVKDKANIDAFDCLEI